MGNRQDIFLLLQQREGEWVSRDDINFVGGEDAGRRMRELREDIAKQGQYRLDERVDGHKRLEYRLVKIAFDMNETTDAKRIERYKWVCTTCDSHPPSMDKTQPSIDPRWRLGPCTPCRNKRASFKRISPLREVARTVVGGGGISPTSPAT